MKQNYRDSNPIVTGLAETLGHTKLLDNLGLISIFNIHSTLIDFQMQIVALLNQPILFQKAQMLDWHLNSGPPRHWAMVDLTAVTLGQMSSGAKVVFPIVLVLCKCSHLLLLQLVEDLRTREKKQFLTSAVITENCFVQST